MALRGKLSHPKRFITSNDESGKAIIDASFADDTPFYDLPDKTTAFAQCHVTKGFPTQPTGRSDIQVYQDYLRNSPGLTVSDGTILRYVDMSPGLTSPMHRTVSLDYGVVVEGEVELILDSGETRILKRGDVCVQRATMHAWRNLSQTEWARMLDILQPTQALEISGVLLKEDLGTMTGVRNSS